MPTQRRPTLQRILAFSEETHKLRIKATVILTSVSLIGQWVDECRKHAPGLNVGVYHNPSGKCICRNDLYALDVIISTSTFEWNKDISRNFKFHRVVVDESHLFATAPSSAKIQYATAKSSSFRWCVTATPFTTSIAELQKQLQFLNHGRVGFSLSHSLRAVLGAFQSLTVRSPQTVKKQAFYDLADVLKKCMIRHTKVQRIHGSEALALPASTTTTIYIDMTQQEREWFDHAHVKKSTLMRMLQRGDKVMALQNCFTFRMNTITPDQAAGLTKIKTLVGELQELRVTEPSFRVVVFTQALAMHKFIVDALLRERMNAFEIKGSTKAKKRDEAIRKFQNGNDTSPAVFVITLRSGNVGITLTAASRVYLIEPSLDPAAEIQAAGRIHRLGQTKAVQVKRLVFRNSVESNIIDLHQEIATGRISISDGFFPPEAVKILANNVRIKDE